MSTAFFKNVPEFLERQLYLFSFPSCDWDALALNRVWILKSLSLSQSEASILPSMLCRFWANRLGKTERATSCQFTSHMSGFFVLLKLEQQKRTPTISHRGVHKYGLKHEEAMPAETQNNGALFIYSFLPLGGLVAHMGGMWNVLLFRSMVEKSCPVAVWREPVGRDVSRVLPTLPPVVSFGYLLDILLTLLCRFNVLYRSLSG